MSAGAAFTTLSEKRVVLVGGAGFIGHHLASRLCAAGATVVIIDGLSVNSLVDHAVASHPEPIRRLYRSMIEERLDLLRHARIPLHVQDAREIGALRRVLDEVQPHAVVHLAGISHAGRSNRDPQAAFEHSLQTLQNSLTAATKRPGFERFVYFSSSMVYGNFATDEVTEETPCDPLGIYGALKYAGERMVLAHHQVFDLPYTIIRPSALYGERCVSRRVAQVFIEQALQGKPLTIAGDGNDRLDFTYIDDLVSGVMRVLQRDGARNETFNLTYGKSHSVGDLVETIRTAFPHVNVAHEARDALMPSRGTLCVDKARQLIGYAPGFPLARGIERYIDWYRATELGDRPKAAATIEAAPMPAERTAERTAERAGRP